MSERDRVSERVCVCVCVREREGESTIPYLEDVQKFVDDVVREKSDLLAAGQGCYLLTWQHIEADNQC